MMCVIECDVCVLRAHSDKRALGLLRFEVRTDKAPHDATNYLEQIHRSKEVTQIWFHSSKIWQFHTLLINH